MDFIGKEIEDIKGRLKNMVDCAAIIGCNRQLIQIKLVKTPHRQLLCQFQFPENYPDNPIIIELKSNLFEVKVLCLLSERCDVEAKKLVGRAQVISMTKFISKFLDDNPLMVCSEEVSYIKKSLVDSQDDLKIKQKSGVLRYKICQDRYFLDVKVTVPEFYPTDCVRVENKSCNFPTFLETHFMAESIEIARRCVEPPLKKDPKAPPFQPAPSLKQVVSYLVKDCIKKFPGGICKLCGKRALPKNPEDYPENPDDEKGVVWIYCNHIYHLGCMDAYMKTPPFTGGKKCIECGKVVYHDRWNISPKLAEERWAHQEARKREIDEVADFLDLM
ncbi:uncharacterized protein LOC135696715 [Rhopilema esculentum]|uniref:uncharacterized protein LOC135696715 n=1 Tax=Rhopilema esculentum TaxID=499914 RepID=UPI0031D36729|eukprot:gene5185-318_t